MNLPGFSAEVSLYRTGGRYRTAGAPSPSRDTVRPAVIDENCYNDCYGYCLNACYDSGGDWYSCSQHCAVDAQYCRDLCCVDGPPICFPDPSHPAGSGCEICDREFCSGPAVSWTTCPSTTDIPLEGPCYLDEHEAPCEYVKWCQQIGICETIQ
jgi:modification target Cys-rich repeat protein